MSTYYLLVSAGGDTLSVDGTTILAYQAGSVEGGDMPFTLTPVFDTALISLPSEVEVWYSTDNVTFSRTAGIAGATWVNNVLSGTVGSSTTVYAKLYYSAGTPVTDENGAGLPLVAVSATVGGAPAPTIGTATITGSTAPTAGAAEAYSVAFDGDATDVTYAWTTTDGGATIATPTASSTNITFAATGSVTVTCTLTSATASDSPVDDTHVVTVAAAGTDWDTYADGVYENLADTVSPYALTTVTASGGYSETGAFRYAGSAGGIQLYGSGGVGAPATLPPFVALWFSEDGINWYWSVLVWNGSTGTSNRYAPVTGGTMPTVDSATPHAIAYLTQDPTAGSNDTSTWSSYT